MHTYYNIAMRPHPFPPSPRGRPPSTSQLPNVGLISNDFLHMVTSSLNMAYVCNSDLEYPKSLSTSSTISPKEINKFTNLLSSFCESGRDMERVRFSHRYLYQLIDLG